MPPPVDLLVIGGGIHGACVARDAARRGLAVTLVEKDDLAQGTSSRSSKLVHGGLRYLETGHLGLVRESLAERAILLQTAPGLVRPLPFLLPFHRGDRRPEWQVRLGLALYDLLSGAGRDAPGSLPRHRRLSPAEARALEPGLPAAGLLGAALYHDAQMDDAGLVIANAVDAAAAGARIVTRTAVTALSAGAGGTWRATLAGAEPVEARLVVNAAGPWADRVRALAHPGAPAALRLTRGAHVVVPALTREHALLLFARDGRVFFVLPSGGRSLVGTTDTFFAGDPDAVRPGRDELALLGDEVERRWPGGATRIQRAIAGLRPLLAPPAGRAGLAPSSLSREARLLDEGGLLSLLGGKYTTARALARQAVDRAVARLGAPARPCDTATAPLPGRVEDEPTPASVARAIEHAFARHAEDVIWRRSGLWRDAVAARQAAPRVAEWMGDRLGWDETRRAAEARAVTDRCDEEETWLE